MSETEEMNDNKEDIDQEKRLDQPIINQSEPKPKKRPGQKPGVDPSTTWKSLRWQGNDEEAFWNWVEDCKPKVKQGTRGSSRYEIWNPTDEQRKLVSAVFARDESGNRKHRIVLAVQPRRHGKSTVFLIIALFYFTARKNFTIGLLGNNDDHTYRTMFKRLEAIVRNTPELRNRIDPDKNFLTDHARLQDPKQTTTWQNRIIKCSVSMAGAFGETLDLLWCSDLHASYDLEPFDAWRAALLDSPDGITLLDSNVDAAGGPIHDLEELAKKEEAIFCSHIEYDNLEDYIERAPSWLNRTEARISSERDLEVAFNRDFLGKRSSAVNALFQPLCIQAAMTPYKMPVEDLQSIAKGRAYKIGGGLDRSKSLLPGLMGSDRTIWTVIMKCAELSGEPSYHILNQVDFTVNIDKAIKSQIVEDHKKYKLDNVCLEHYETMDLSPWLSSQGIPVELVFATDSNQNAIFPEFHRIVKKLHFHIPTNCQEMADEMKTFVYKQRPQAGSYTFGHQSQKFHDDRVYSTAWAIFSLRNAILDVFRIGCIQCQQKQAIRRQLCFLFGGRQVLYCSEDCPAFFEVQAMFREFEAFHAQDSELDIVGFYKTYVKADGIISYQVV